MEVVWSLVVVVSLYRDCNEGGHIVAQISVFFLPALAPVAGDTRADPYGLVVHSLLIGWPSSTATRLINIHFHEG